MTEGYTEIEYGTGTGLIKITNCTTLKFEQEAMFDQSGLVHAYTKFTVRVSGYLLAQTTARTQITPNLGAAGQGSYFQTAASQHVGLRHKLETPRQVFKMTLGVGGPNPTVLLTAKPIGSANDILTKEFDAQGGPIPKVLSVGDGICRAVIRCTGKMFRRLVEDEEWHRKIS